MKIITLIATIILLTPSGVSAQIEPGATFYIDPIWSPSGDQIAFTSNRDGKTDIWTIQSDGTHLMNLTAAIPGENAFPVWSPDGTQIALLSTVNEQHSIWVVSSKGQAARQLSPEGANAVIEPVEWSPDGSQIAFATYLPASGFVYTLWLTTLSGEPPHLLTEGSAPAWSPDGTWIAFLIWDENQALDIGLIRPDGSDYQRFDVNLIPFFITLRWSPDSKQIAYNSGTEPVLNNARDLWVIDIAAMQPRQYTFGMGVAGIRWSPDGSMIAFRNEDSLARGGLWVIQSDGQGLQELVPATYEEQSVIDLAWSPEGQRLAFTDSRFDEALMESAIEDFQAGDTLPDLTQNDLWMVNLDGSNLVNLTENISASAGIAKWSPDGSQLVFTTGGITLIPTSFIDAIWIMNADGSNQRMLIGNESN